MPVLVLLNGAPASGKSTLARLWAEQRPLALALDIDVVRSMIPSWQEDPESAGLAARDLAVAMIGIQLELGRDVIVPQYVARAAFVDRLTELAHRHRVPFVHIVVRERAEITEQRFRARASAHESDPKRVSPVLYGPLGSEPMEDVIAAHERFIDQRAEAVVVAAVDGDLPESLHRLQEAIERDSRGHSTL